MISLSVSSGVEVASRLYGKGLRTIILPVAASKMKNDFSDIRYNSDPCMAADAPLFRSP